MARNIVKSVAELLLDGEGLKVAQRITEDLVAETRADKSPGSADRLESIAMLRRELRKLGEEKGGAS